MFIDSQKAEKQAVINQAYAICAPLRTAPKACGIDHLDTAIITDEDIQKISAEMRKIGQTLSAEFFLRDADNVDTCYAIVLVGAKYEPRDLNEICGICGFDSCAACVAAGATCVFTGMDLGIALGSAVSLAADNRIDNRIMYTIGKAATALGLLGDYKMIMGIPLSVSGKSPFFDRE